MRAILASTCLLLALGGCAATRSAFDAINIFGGGNDANPEAAVVPADQTIATKDQIKALPRGLGGDTEKANHLDQSFQPAKPM